MTRQLDLTVQGVVGTNPALSRVGDNARPYCRFRVAVTPTYRTEQGWNNAETIWFTAKAWGQLAANLSHSLRKGDAVLLTGRFSQESWESNGRKHETNVITLQAAGHDLTRGESRFARVRAAESAPSASSGAGTGDAELEPAYAGLGGGLVLRGEVLRVGPAQRLVRTHCEPFFCCGVPGAPLKPHCSRCSAR